MFTSLECLRTNCRRSRARSQGTIAERCRRSVETAFVALEMRTVETLTLSYGERYNGWRKEPSRFLFEMGLLESAP